MRMFRLSSWISESRGCDKVVNGDADHNMADATRPVVEILPEGVVKRKRAPSEDAPDVTTEAHEAKRQRQHALLLHETDLGGDVEEPVVVEKEMVADASHVRETIECQFSLDILLKHKELRLINQELAKCQVALEQLRRCHLIPYPTTHGSPEAMLNISNGTGPALKQTESVPQWAPPYGVTEGPYSRHYARWLIPDPSFDGLQVEWNRGLESSRAGKTVPEGRATRHSFAEGSGYSNKSRSQRGSAGQKLQALSSGYPQAKEKAGPCVLKRGDGQMVKLVCIDCHRDNFSSTQGFINHCRIAHRRDFKSHEEAAVASGQPIEVDDAGGIVGEEKTPSIATGLVHPLIRSAPTGQDAYTAILAHINASMAMFEQGRLPGVTSIPTSATSTPLKAKAPQATVTPHKDFVPSSDTPHLSALMCSKGFGGNLTDLVSDARKQVDFDDLSHDEDSEEGERNFNVAQRQLGHATSDSPLPPMRMPARAAMSPAPLGRPGSSKGMSGISPRLSHATPVINTAAAVNHNRTSSLLGNESRHEQGSQLGADVDLEMMDGPSMVELSPNTVASNNAPSLVSDDGEYDEGDDAESASSEEDEDSVAEIDIEDDGVDKVVPRTVLRDRSGSGGDASMRLRKEDKHVTFVSPVKEGTKDGRRRK